MRRAFYLFGVGESYDSPHTNFSSISYCNIFVLRYVGFWRASNIILYHSSTRGLWTGNQSWICAIFRNFSKLMKSWFSPFWRWKPMRFTPHQFVLNQTPHKRCFSIYECWRAYQSIPYRFHRSVAYGEEMVNIKRRFSVISVKLVKSWFSLFWRWKPIIFAPHEVFLYQTPHKLWFSI